MLENVIGDAFEANAKFLKFHNPLGDGRRDAQRRQQ